MPALDKKSRGKEKRRRWKFYLVLAVIMIVLSPIVAEALDTGIKGLLQGEGFEFHFEYVRCLQLLVQDKNRQRVLFLAYLLLTCLMILAFYRVDPTLAKSDTVEVANGICIPVPAGNGEFGTAHFMSPKEMDKVFGVAVYHRDLKEIKNLSLSAGIIVDFEKRGNKEIIRYLMDPVNTLLIGATRAGKTRRLLMTSIWLSILAGINRLVVDVKGEVCAFTSPFARENGYDVRILDFRAPERSMHFNNLAEIVKLLNKGQISEAVNKAWDIVSILVGEPKGERIWTDGQCATIAAAILIVAADAPEGCKNLTNVYYFLAYMCETDPDTGNMPINDYIENLPDNHPARGAFQVAKIAPFKTRGSFFTGALATLRLYTAWNVADVTGASDFTLEDTDEKKVIYYLIFPDENTTYHPIGSIFMKQLYESLVKQSYKKGGKLDRKFIFGADEIANFPVIPNLGTMTSAGAGRNIFFEFIIQDDQQMESKYKDDFRNIRTNCQLTICLKATDEQTTKRLSTRLGNYTIRTNSASSSLSDGRSAATSYSSNANLTGRPLLYPDEISNIDKPDALILYGGKKAITNLPDLSEYSANKAFGMGDEEFNKKLFLERIKERPEREISAPMLWGIWEEYGAEQALVEEEEKKNSVSFI